MNLPISPPTDNLYKFLAIAGLILLVAGVLIPQQKFHDYQKKRIQLGAEDSWNNEQLALLKQTVSQIQSAKQSGGTNYDREFAQGLVKKSLDDAAGVMRWVTTRDAKNEELQWELEFLHNSEVWGKIFIALGVVCLSLGFPLWYFKVQRYQDAILKAEASKPKAPSSGSLPATTDVSP